MSDPIDEAADLRVDYDALRSLLDWEVRLLGEVELRPKDWQVGSDVAALSRERRMLRSLLVDLQSTIDEVADLRGDYADLGRLLTQAEGSAAAAIARERRIIRRRLTELEESAGGTVLDEVAARRERQASAPRPPARRRQSR